MTKNMKIVQNRTVEMGRRGEAADGDRVSATGRGTGRRRVVC